MTKTHPRTIALKCKGQRLERNAASGSAIKPGHLVEIDANDEVDVFAGAQGAKGTGRLLVATESALDGRTIDDAYSPGDVVFLREVLPGDEVLLRSEVGADYDIGSLIIRNAATGTVIKTTGSPASQPFVSNQDFTTTAGVPFVNATCRGEN